VGPDRSTELNRQFLEYQKFFAEAQKLAKGILEQLATARNQAS
jgi:hypothetical protein